METNFLNQSTSNETQMNGRETLPRPMMGFKEAVDTCFAKYAVFKGRARRSEYWWFSLFILLVTAVLLGPVAVLAYLEESGVINTDTGLWSAGFAISAIMAIIGALFLLAMIIPSIAVEVRRLHDIGRSGWWVFWSFAVSFLAAIVPFFLFDFKVALEMDEIDMFTKAFDMALLPGLLLGVTKLCNWILEIVLFVFTLLNSHKGENKYGPSPKYQ